jgi:hypothetical protein
VAQTKKKRRKKRRGTQSGRVDTRRAPRPRNRQEAQARARSRGGKRGATAQRRDQPPTWRGAIVRGLVATGLFVVLVAFVFGRPLTQAVPLGLLMLAFYIPMGYYIDRFFYNRRQRALQKEREAGKSA